MKGVLRYKNEQVNRGERMLISHEPDNQFASSETE